jgi:hypothetical protein
MYVGENEVATLPKVGMVARYHEKSAVSSKTFGKQDSPSLRAEKGVTGNMNTPQSRSRPSFQIPAIIPGRDGDDAKAYLERHIADKINESTS